MAAPAEPVEMVVPHMVLDPAVAAVQAVPAAMLELVALAVSAVQLPV